MIKHHMVGLWEKRRFNMGGSVLVEDNLQQLRWQEGGATVLAFSLTRGDILPILCAGQALFGHHPPIYRKGFKCIKVFLPHFACVVAGAHLAACYWLTRGTNPLPIHIELVLMITLGKVKDGVEISMTFGQGYLGFPAIETSSHEDLLAPSLPLEHCR